MTEITVTVKCSNDTKYTVTIDKSKTVLEFKQIIAEKSETPANRQRLIYSGKVLKDNDTLETYKLAEGHTVHMVKSMEVRDSSQSTTQPQSTTTSTTNTTNNQSTPSQNTPPPFGMAPNPFAALGGFGGGGNFNPPDTNHFGTNFGGNNNGIPNWNMMEQTLNDPMMMQYVSQMMQDPQFVDNVIAMNPQFSAMAPQLRQMTQDPTFQALLSNPNAIRQMMGSGGHGTGMFPPTTNPTTGNSLLNSAATMNPTGNPNTNQQQQQQQQPIFPIDPALLFGLGGLGSSPTVSQQPPEERFQVQLQQLNDMGFWDAQKNIRALLASGGNVNSAIELLLSNSFN